MDAGMLALPFTWARGTADFGRGYVATGDPTGEEALASGSYLRQQWAGLRRFVLAVAGPERRS